MRLYFGGTFDPVHFGHLHAADAGRRALAAARVTFVLSARPPHRAPPQASFTDRLEMLNRAASELAWFAVSDMEADRDGPSYTVDTVADLAAAGDDPVVWMFGADGLASFTSWHRWQELPRYCHFLVLARPGSALTPLPGFTAVDDAAALATVPAGKVFFLPTPMLDISATEVRRRVAAGEDLNGLIPPGVRTYIKERGLYKI